jgi:hypothetical protein
MTEAEWLECSHPSQLLEFLGARAPLSPRKLRLFACACCRLLWDWFDEPCRAAVEAAEAYADGRLSEADREAARLAAWQATAEQLGWGSMDEYVAGLARCVLESSAEPMVEAALDALAEAPYLEWHHWGLMVGGESFGGERALAAQTLRDLAGDPFRPAPRVDPAWLSANGGAASRLAASIYEGGDWAALPVLADALADAGCGELRLLSHLRGPGPHGKGCWALDLLLGKLGADSTASGKK